MTRSFTFQAKLAVLTLRHMNSLSATGKRNEQIFTFWAWIFTFMNSL